MSFTLLRDKNLAYVSLLLFLLPKFIGGTATLTFDNFFGYRSLGQIFLIYYLSYLIEKKFKKAAGFALLSLIFHPLSILPSLVLMPVFHERFKLLNFFIKYKTFISILLIIIFILFLNTRDYSWLSIIKSRDDYLFPSQWGIRGWLSLFMYYSIVLILTMQLTIKYKKIVTILILILTSLFIFNFIGLEVFQNPALARLQLVRSISPIAYIALAISPLFLGGKNALQTILGTLSIVFLALNQFELFTLVLILFLLCHALRRGEHIKLMKPLPVYLLICTVIGVSLFVAYLNNKNSLSTINYPKPQDEWVEVQIWAKNNTNQFQLFLIDPSLTGFRIFSERQISGDIKDGAVVIYDRSYARYWQNLINSTKDFDSLTEDQLMRINKDEKYQFIVTKKNNLTFSKTFENQKYTIYKF